MFIPKKPNNISGQDVEHVLQSTPTRWDRQVTADIVAEMEIHLSEAVDSLPAMRIALATAGYRGLQQRILQVTNGKSGTDALRAMAFAMRSYALGSPGLAAASFRNPQIDSPEWKEAGSEMAETIFRVFAGVGIEGEAAQHAVRILGSLVRGFILNEIASTSSQPIEFQKSYVLGVELFIQGLSVLRSNTDQHVLDC
jgi:Tetracyclin repressor-like, C-terminal domain